MADETTEPETTEAQEYQPPPTVVVLYDRDGRERHTSPSSKFAVDGLADGTLTEQPPEAPPADDGEKTEEAGNGASEAGSAGDDPQSGNSDGNAGSGDGSADPTGTGGRRRASKA